jgi:5-methylcytosine-specific restriction enzyme subunit McrC
MAYARLYRCDRLLLLYPAVHGDVHGQVHTHGIAHGHERLNIASISLEAGDGAIQRRLRELVCFEDLPSPKPKEVEALLGAF